MCQGVKPNGNCDVSVIVPVYNQEKYIDACLASVLEQSLAVREIIVVDDGSTDSTPSKLASYGNQIKVVRQENRGVSAARNLGVSQASSSWIMFLDSDDELSLHNVESQLQFFSETGLPLGYCDAKFVDSNGLVIGGTGGKREKSLELVDLPGIFDTSYPPTSGMMIKKELFENVGGFDESLKTAEDTDLVLKVAKTSKLQHVKEELVIVRRYENSLSGTADTYKDEIYMLERFFRENPEYSKTNNSLSSRVLSRSFYRWADDLLYKGDNMRAASKAARSIFIAPSAQAFKILLKAMVPSQLKNFIKDVRK